MQKIKTFKVFKHPTLGYQAVKVGFSWPGFFFSGIWLLYKRLWGYALVFFLISLLLSFIEVSFEKEKNTGGMFLTLWLQIGVYLFVGFKGNLWQENRLLNRGFQFVKSVQAETPTAAIANISNA